MITSARGQVVKFAIDAARTNSGAGLQLAGTKITEMATILLIFSVKLGAALCLRSVLDLFSLLQGCDWPLWSLECFARTAFSGGSACSYK
jgi:hypothetical protein